MAEDPAHQAGPVEIAFDREGAGEPLLLMHGIGMSRSVWRPVIPLLRERRDVIAVDLPGHGASPPVPAHILPAPPGLARLMAQFLDQLGVERAHAAGNSLGAWTALELAKLGRARSAVALDPAGLWERGNISSFAKLLGMRRSARRLVTPASYLMRTRVGHHLLLRDTIGRPRQVPAEDGVKMIRDLAEATGFEQTLVATHARRFEGGQGIDVPVTVVFGTRERLIPKRSRRNDELPSHARWLEPEGLGHVPMWDDPQLVAEIILTGGATTGVAAASEATTGVAATGAAATGVGRTGGAATGS